MIDCIFRHDPVGIYMFKVNNRKTRTSEIWPAVFIVNSGKEMPTG